VPGAAAGRLAGARIFRVCISFGFHRIFLDNIFMENIFLHIFLLYDYIQGVYFNIQILAITRQSSRTGSDGMLKSENNPGVML